MKRMSVILPSLIALATMTAATADQVTGPSSSRTPYIVPVAQEVDTVALITVGDSVNLKPDGVTPYRFVGIPDGMGAYDNGDGTFTVLCNHELNGGSGAARAHGGTGAFVSKWTIDKGSFAVIHGQDLIQQVYTWDTVGGNYVLSPTEAISRLCSGDLPAVSAFYNSASGLGTQSRIFTSGEEVGAPGRAFAHVATGPDAGKSYELAWAGNFSWENAVASPAESDTTVLIGLDDATGGQVYVYVGTKSDTGNEIEKAGLHNGNLYGVAVTGLTEEDTATGLGGPASLPFTLNNFGDVSDWDGDTLQSESESNGVTEFLRPEDGHFDPKNPNDFYWVTTGSGPGPARLWRFRFEDVTNPTLGGTVELLLDGTEGGVSLDNLVADPAGHVLIQEDPGGSSRLAKVWLYDIKADLSYIVAEHSPEFFESGMPSFLTTNEESSGIIDMRDILGAGWYLANVQAHYDVGDSELVEGGQLLALYIPQGASITGDTSSQRPYVIPTRPGVEAVSLMTVGDSVNLEEGPSPYRLVGIPDGTGAYDNGDGTFTWLVNHELNNTQGAVRDHGGTGAFVSSWTVDAESKSILHGEDLIQTVWVWDVDSASYVQSLSEQFSRLCSADLPAQSALYDAATGTGTMEKIFSNGEESGAEGRAWAHIATGPNAGTTYELPWHGKLSFENCVVAPQAGQTTVTIGLDDATGGQVYVYVGQKSSEGNEIERAGLTGGNLYGVAVTGVTEEDPATGLGGPTSLPFTLHNFGDVSSWDGGMLESESGANGVTEWLRPEDGHFDPNNPNDFYWVTTGASGGPARMWRFRFYDITNPTAGGTVEMLLDGTEGGVSLDNLTVDHLGRVFIQEDPGGSSRLAKIWMYDIASDTVEIVAEHNADYFLDGGINFLTQNEEASGIIDAVDVMGAGWYLLDVQAHYNIGDSELVEGGQLVALYVAPPTGPGNGDFDSDGDVDLVDFGQFSVCFTGPCDAADCSDEPLYSDANCANGDFDGDGDVDLLDFGQFQIAFTGML